MQGCTATRKEQVRPTVIQTLTFVDANRPRKKRAKQNKGRIKNRGRTKINAQPGVHGVDILASVQEVVRLVPIPFSHSIVKRAISEERVLLTRRNQAVSKQERKKSQSP
jgi:hypothetical protein